MDPLKRAVRENFDLSAAAYRDYEAGTGRFEALAGRLCAVMAERGATFGRVLDAGAGTGASTAVLAEHGEVVALDLSRSMLAANQAGRRVQGDIETLPFADGGFDAVAFTASLFLVPDPTGAAREARRVLRAGGHVGAVAPVGWFVDGRNVLDDLPRESRSPQAVDDVRGALGSVFDLETGTWTFDATAEDLRDFFDIPAGAARLYPNQPPDERREAAAALLADLEGPVEHRWRWFVGR